MGGFELEKRECTDRYWRLPAIKTTFILMFIHVYLML